MLRIWCCAPLCSTEQGRLQRPQALARLYCDHAALRYGTPYCLPTIAVMHRHILQCLLTVKIQIDKANKFGAKAHTECRFE